MYIPTVFFSEGTESEFLVASGGLETTWVSGSYIWKSHAFTSSGTSSFVVTSGNTSEAKVLLVGSGGSRGLYLNPPATPFFTPGAGGGGGMLEYSNQNITSGSYQVVVGEAKNLPPGNIGDYGVTGLNGDPSIISGSTLSLSVLGGGGGGGGNGNGANGGTGGGAGLSGSAGSGTSPQGFNGGEDFKLVGGPGGGAGQAGNTKGQGYGGDGRQSTLFYGVNSYYGGGGSHSTTSPSINLAPNGLGFYGLGARYLQDVSNSGIVIIAYPYSKVSTLRTELARFTPTIPSGTLEYIEAVSGELRQYNFTTTASIDLCIVSGSQYNVYNTGSNDLYINTSLPFVNSNVTKTTLSINSCI